MVEKDELIWMYCDTCSKNTDKILNEKVYSYSLFSNLYNTAINKSKRGLRSSNDLTMRLIKLLLWMVNNTNTDDTKLEYITSDKDYSYIQETQEFIIESCHKIVCEKCQSIIKKNCSTDFEEYSIKSRVSKLIKSNIVTKLFDFMIQKDVNRVCINKWILENHKWSQVLKDKIKELNTDFHNPICHKWKGCNHYYYKFFGIPYTLENLVDPLHYNYRVNIYFNDVIAGHPKASHGWYQESLQNFKELTNI